MAAGHPGLPSFSVFLEGHQGGHCQDSERQRFAPTEISVLPGRRVLPVALKEPAMIGAMAPGETGALVLEIGAPAWSFFWFFLSRTVRPPGRGGAIGNFCHRGSAVRRCACTGRQRRGQNFPALRNAGRAASNGSAGGNDLQPQAIPCPPG